MSAPVRLTVAFAADNPIERQGVARAISIMGVSSEFRSTGGVLLSRGKAEVRADERSQHFRRNTYAHLEASLGRLNECLANPCSGGPAYSALLLLLVCVERTGLSPVSRDTSGLAHRLCFCGDDG